MILSSGTNKGGGDARIGCSVGGIVLLCRHGGACTGHAPVTRTGLRRWPSWLHSSMPLPFFSAWEQWHGSCELGTRRRYWDKSPSDLHYIAAGAALLVSAGIGILFASQIVMVLGYVE